MIAAEIPADEARRLAALRALDLHDGSSWASFDAITRAAALVCEAPIAALVLIDADRQRFLSGVGLKKKQTARDVSFCAHAILQGEIFEVPDASLDPRFFDNPQVIGPPGIRFYACAPLVTADGLRLGGLGVLDRRPRGGLDDTQRAVLRELAEAVMRLLESQKAEHEAQAEIGRANELLELAQQVGQFGHFEEAPDSGKLSWSRQLYRIFGFDPDAGPPEFEQLLASFHPDDRAEVVARTQEARETGEPYDIECRILRRDDGEQRDIRSVIHPRRSASGEGWRRFGVVKDVTDRNRSELRARRERDRFQAIFDTVVDSIFIVEHGTGRLIEANESGRRVFGYARDELVGLTIGDISSGQAPYTLAGVVALHQDIALGDTRVFEWRCKTKDGRLFWAEVSTRYAHFGDRPAVLALVHDISDRKAAESERERLKERAEQANRAKSAFLAKMSHELRTPMSGLIGMNALLLETDLSPDQRKMSETVRYSAHALLDLLDEVLDFAKLDVGRVELEILDFDLAALVRKSVELVSARAQEKGLSLRAEISGLGERAVRGDPSRLRQILLNLITNAIKFTEQGEVVVAVSATADDGEAMRLRFEVRDTGPGVPDDLKDKIFQPFEQADSSISRRFGGTGLGLSICRELAALMGGSIAVSDRTGGGAVFGFEIVLPASRPHAAAAAAAPPAGAAPRLAGRVLVAEDNKVNADFVRLVLKKAGFEVWCVADGAAAVEAARSHAFDLILMDMQMPRMDGPAASRAIRATPGDGRRIPIVALTANALPEDEALCRDAGMDDFLAKPIAPAKLRAIAARWIKGAAA